MYSAIASGIFAARNVDKTSDGEIGRSAVALGQTAGVIQEIAKYDGMIAKGARSAVSVFSDLAKQNKAFEYAGKVTKFAVDNVNPLICASGVIKTAMSDDKLQTGITEVTALSAMFAGEAFCKNNYEKFIKSKSCQEALAKAAKNKYLKPVFEYLEKHKLKGKAGMIVKALAFIGASMTSYTIGHELGDDLAHRVKANWGVKDKIDQKA